MAREKRPLALAAAGAALAVVLFFLIFEPVPGGHRYDLGLKLCLPLFLFFLLFELKPELAFKKWVLIIVAAAGLAIGAGSLATIERDSEIVQVYRTVFAAIDSGANPYVSGTIFHRDAEDRAVYGNFNYPPAEIYPYYLAAKLAGRWNASVLVISIILINVLACVILRFAFNEAPFIDLLPYFIFISLVEIKTNPGMTLLFAALIIFVLRKIRPEGDRAARLALAALFGLGLATKFFIIPLAAVYYWQRLTSGKARCFRRVVVEGGVTLLTVLLTMLPYGVLNVVRSTIIFNLALKERAVFTTFYPNVLSGLATLAGLDKLYPFLAVALLGAAVLISVKKPILEAMFWVSAVFLWVSSTPEPQYLPVMAALFLAVLLERARDRETAPADPSP